MDSIFKEMRKGIKIAIDCVNSERYESAMSHYEYVSGEANMVGMLLENRLISLSEEEEEEFGRIIQDIMAGKTRVLRYIQRGRSNPTNDSPLAGFKAVMRRFEKSMGI